MPENSDLLPTATCEGASDISKADVPVSMVIQQETSLAVLKNIFRLRAFVWRQLSGESGLFGDEWTDELDACALHWAAHVNGNLVAAARMSVHQQLEDMPDFHIFRGLHLSLELPIASFNRLVVHPDFRGMGLSRELDARRLEAARKLKCRTITALASKLSGKERLHTFQRTGFSPVAPMYSIRDRDSDWVTPMVLVL